MANVFLLEPDRVLAATYGKALEHRGHVVATAEGAQDAIHALETFHPDVIVLELQLATHGGIEFLHELRSYPEWQTTPVIINTNIAPQTLSPLRAVLERDLGVSICLYKPRTSLTQFLRAVGEQVSAV
jgi:CheY-like chemotaxis protein